MSQARSRQSTRPRTPAPRGCAPRAAPPGPATGCSSTTSAPSLLHSLVTPAVSSAATWSSCCPRMPVMPCDQNLQMPACLTLRRAAVDRVRGYVRAGTSRTLWSAPTRSCWCWRRTAACSTTPHSSKPCQAIRFWGIPNICSISRICCACACFHAICVLAGRLHGSCQQAFCVHSHVCDACTSILADLAVNPLLQAARAALCCGPGQLLFGVRRRAQETG
jgi:hypothetical protein